MDTSTLITATEAEALGQRVQIAADPNWRLSKKTVRARVKYMFNNEYLSDIVFLVSYNGGPVERFYAHRFILATASSVFDDMLYEDWEDGSSRTTLEIKIEDVVEPRAFLKMLRFLYTDELDLDKDVVDQMMKLSRKYKLCVVLEKACIVYMEERVTVENACDYLSHALASSLGGQLEKNCWDVIDPNAEAVLKTEGFKRVTLRTLEKIFSRDTLECREIRVWDAAINWFKAKQTCRITNPKDDLRVMLGPAFDLIRFPTMSLKEFANGPDKMKVLTHEETCEVYRHISHIMCSNKPEGIENATTLPFSCAPRQAKNSTEERQLTPNSSTSTVDMARNAASPVGANETPQPGPSSAIPPCSSLVQSTESIKHEQQIRRSTRLQVKNHVMGGIPLERRSSEWLMEVIPRKTPYVPQIGDQLVYFKHGHLMYAKNVKKNKHFTMPEQSLPYVRFPYLDADVSCRIMDMKFEYKPGGLRLAFLTLQMQEWEIGNPTGTHFTVRFHDVPGVPDFFVLRQVYDESIRNTWAEDDRCQCICEDTWWPGTVNWMDSNKHYPDTKFMCYDVTFDNGENAKLSPWEMETIPEGHEQTSPRGIYSSNADMQTHAHYNASPEEWPPSGNQDEMCTNISRLIGQVMNLAIAQPFCTPGDYGMKAAYPMDLSTIKARLDNRFYRRVDAVKFDVNFIATNSEKLKKFSSGLELGQSARVITDLCLELIKNPDVQDIDPVFLKCVDSFFQRQLQGEGKSRTGQNEPTTSTQLSQRHSGGVDENNEQESVLSWKDKCRNILDAIWDCEDAVFIRRPVHPDKYPDYSDELIDTKRNICRL